MNMVFQLILKLYYRYAVAFLILCNFLFPCLNQHKHFYGFLISSPIILKLLSWEGPFYDEFNPIRKVKLR